LWDASGGGVERGSDRGSGDSAVEEELRGDLLDIGEDVVLLCLGGEHALSDVAMAFALAVLLVGILHADVLVHEVLAVHVGDGVVGGLEGGVGDEAVALGEPGLVAGDLWRLDERAEARECVVEGLLVDEGVQVADEELSSDFDGLLLVCGGLGRVSIWSLVTCLIVYLITPPIAKDICA
jgi:hypothetical protein